MSPYFYALNNWLEHNHESGAMNFKSRFKLFFFSEKSNRKYIYGSKMVFSAIDESKNITANFNK
jgi:hypothetical protein